MKKLFLLALLFSVPALAQNLTTVSGSNIQDLNGAKLATGQICFLGTDNQDNPISFGIGGGGQALKRPYCAAVTAGVITGFTVPNPALTNPSGIYYRVTVKDTSSGLEVLRYLGVTFSGATFNFDNYIPVLQNASLAPLTGTSVSGNLSVTGNVGATGTVTGSNIPAGQLATGAGTTNAIPKYTNGATAAIGNSDLTDDGNVLTVNDSIAITANTGLGTVGTGGKIAGGFTNPSAIRIYCGDGTGWHCEFAKRTGSTDTVEAWITDGGVFNILTGFQINGSATSGNVLRGNGTNFVAAQLAASDLSNGVTGSGAVALAASPTFTGIVNSAELFAGTAPGSASAGDIGASRSATVGALWLGSDGNATIFRNGSTTLSYHTTTTDFFFPAVNDTAVGRATTDTLTNKTISGASNTLTLTPNHQIFTSSGTFTIPSGVKAVKVTIVGAGGAGGGATTAAGSAAGGASGATAIKWLTGLTSGNTITVTVGTGGTGVANAAGNTGGNSSISSGTQTITTVTGGGGIGGGPASANNGSDGPSATNGDINIGGSASPTGVAGSSNSGAPGGPSSFGGSGGPGLAAAGHAGNAPGAGGGGAGGTAVGTVAGGAGANGIVIFEWVN